MANGPIVRVSGLRELLKVTDKLPKQTARDVRNELRNVAVPIKEEAQSRLVGYLSEHTRSKYKPTSHTRFGISVRKTGTVTVEQRVKSKKSRDNRKLKRPKFIDLQFDEALDPAAEHNLGKVDEAMNRVLDKLAERWAA